MIIKQTRKAPVERDSLADRRLTGLLAYGRNTNVQEKVWPAVDVRKR